MATPAAPLVPGPLADMVTGTDTVLWNDSADLEELGQSIGFGAVGATCNPVIAYTTIKKWPQVWGPRIRSIAEANPTWGESQIGWEAVREMSVEAAALLVPAFEAHQGRNGRLSMQTDPRLHRDPAALVDQAVEFAALAPNIIVKIPATETGVAAMEEATYRGVSINATVSFSVPQVLAVGEAVERGLRRREAEGLDVSAMGPVVTLMVGRLDDWLKVAAARDGIDVDPAHLEWAGVAAIKRAYQIFTERGYRARVLSAAFRNLLQWSELVGGDLVISPPFAWQQKIQASGIPAEHRIDEPIAPEILATLTKLEDFRRAYEPDGLTPAEFAAFPPTARTLRQFLAADADLDTLVRDVILPNPDPQ
ncbi:MAG: transaldolase family protein [Nocardioidaceae bacterium]